MYRYDEFDHQFVRERVAQFRGQIERHLSGALDADEFRPLRLMNGLYLQLHAYMLRVAIPYGTLSARQMRKLADIAETYDRGYGHFTTRQNIQYNWPRLRDVPDILEELVEVEMHAIQTSGNCIRNVTADPLSGVADDEVEDPRPTAELIRQWSSLHPEFSFLPRKFKIAVTGSPHDRAAIKAHDIGIRIVRDASGATGYEIWVGGGQGRTPFVAKLLRRFLPKAELLPYLEAMMRVYNLYGRRDNKFKARIKILVHEIGVEEYARRVEEEYARLDGHSIALDAEEVARIDAYFAPPAYERLAARPAGLDAARKGNAGFDAWVAVNTMAHKVPGYAIVTVSLKPVGTAPGDATTDQMRLLADAAERYSLDELRVTMEQNIVLPNVRQDDLYALWKLLASAGLATANAGLIGDIVSCPGLDYCALATARSIPIAQAISHRFADPERQRLIGPLSIKISGCINACGHHHIGHIGILGLEKAGGESYQITLGGEPLTGGAIGERLGPGLTAAQTVDAIERLVEIYFARRQPGEPFADAYRRLGHDRFKEALHAFA
ncbi:MAG: nitrite/sulfite reductase [Alphaproteobacteria bacterium]